MGTYSAAKSAVKAALAAGWTTTVIAYENENPPDPWPPTVDVPGSDFPDMLPWVYFEMDTMPGQTIRGAGMPGNQISQTSGFIMAHVFVPGGTGEATATEYAEQIGELFRTKVPYRPGDGCYLRTWVPRVGAGEKTAIDNAPGNWWRCSVSVPFAYYHRG